MSRLIDADALLRDIEHYHLSDGKFQHWVEIQQTIERKTGKWIKRGSWYCCSECGAEMFFTGVYDENQHYCYNCGSYNGGGDDVGDTE